MLYNVIYYNVLQCYIMLYKAYPHSQFYPQFGWLYPWYPLIVPGEAPGLRGLRFSEATVAEVPAGQAVDGQMAAGDLSCLFSFCCFSFSIIMPICLWWWWWGWLILLLINHYIYGCHHCHVSPWDNVVLIDCSNAADPWFDWSLLEKAEAV
jgi:hypothetical protein